MKGGEKIARGCGRTNGNISQIGQCYTGQNWQRERETDKYRREGRKRIKCKLKLMKGKQFDLSLCKPSRYMKEEVELPLYLTSELYRGQWSTSRRDLFTSSPPPPPPICRAYWVFRAGFYTIGQRKTPCPAAVKN
jgi:hypothetical protein